MNDTDCTLIYVASCTRRLHALIEAEVCFAALDDEDRRVLNKARSLSEDLMSFSRGLVASVKRHEQSRLEDGEPSGLEKLLAEEMARPRHI